MAQRTASRAAPTASDYAVLPLTFDSGSTFEDNVRRDVMLSAPATAEQQSTGVGVSVRTEYTYFRSVVIPIF